MKHINDLTTYASAFHRKTYLRHGEVTQKRDLALTVSAIALAVSIGTLLPHAAVAQTVAGDQQAGQVGSALEEVVVTARKRSENLQATPVAVSVFSAQELEDRTISSMADLTAIAPSLSMSQSNYGPFGAYFGIRGQKTGDTILSQTPSVGIYVDDVYHATTAAMSLPNFADVDQIEVLKGPQGTLYGRNTTGGAIRINNHLPDYDGISGFARVGFGNYGENQAAVVLNVPIVDNQVALRVSAERDYHDGWGKSILTGIDINDIDARTYRAALRLDPTDDLEVLLRGDYGDGRSHGLTENLVSVVPGSLATVEAALQRFGAITPANIAKGYTFLTSLEQHNYSYNTYQDSNEDERVRDAGTSATITYKLDDDLELKNIAAWRYFSQYSLNDLLPGPVHVLEGHNVSGLGQTSEELQLGGNGLDHRLKWTAGYYFWHLSGNDDSPGVDELPFLNPGSPINARDHLFDTSNALYGQGTYALTPSLNLTAGLRWTTEQTELLTHSMQGNPVAPTCALPPPAGVGRNPCVADFKNSFRNISYTAGLDWTIAEGLLVYGKTSRGFKAGGQNQRGGPTGGFEPFAPEVVTDYEVGVKADFFDRRLRVDAAGYHSDYSNVQRTVVVTDPSGQTVTIVNNAASATIDGVELEVTGRPIPQLTIHASGSYTYPQYLKFISETASGAPLDLTSQGFESQPRWQSDLTVTYVQPTPIGALSATIDWSYTGKQDFQAAEHFPGGTSAVGIQSGYSLWNASTSLDIDEFDSTLQFWMRNLTDKKYIIGAFDQTEGSLGFGYVTPAAPRTFGFTFTKRF